MDGTNDNERDEPSRKHKPSPDQLPLAFEAHRMEQLNRRNELLARINGLRRVPLGIAPALVEGVITLLRRIILLVEEYEGDHIGKDLVPAGACGNLHRRADQATVRRP